MPCSETTTANIKPQYYGTYYTLISIEYYLPEKQSILDAMEHLLARYRLMRPLFLSPARPMNVEWYSRPYLGVFERVFSARNRAFSAPGGGGMIEISQMFIRKVFYGLRTLIGIEYDIDLCSKQIDKFIFSNQIYTQKNKVFFRKT